MTRIKTRYVGVYYRIGKNRLDLSGKPDKCYDIHIKVHGKDIWEKVGWKSEGFTLQDAISLRALRIREYKHPELCKTPEGVTINEVWKKYEEIWLPNLKSAEGIKYAFKKHILTKIGNLNIKELSPIDVENLKHLLLKTHKPNTVRTILKCLRRVLNKGKEWGLIKSEINLTKSCFAVQHSDIKRERYLEPFEAERILDGLQLYNCTLYYIAKIALFTGMRLGEIVNLRSMDINLNARLIYIDGKTGHRVAYISEYIIDDFRRLMLEDAEQKIFSAYNKRTISKQRVSFLFAEFIKRAGFNYGITDSSKKIVFHTFRHTFCSWLAMEGVPLLIIGQLVGHSSTNMTERYAKLSPDTKKEALEKIFIKLKKH